mmetsp:Transcript_18775/g.27834  ORF Transcript_18775/g.27834 Transcript_18775/m.27834 type:complete len:89 (-) Transcript_18775:77-343(-)
MTCLLLLAIASELVGASSFPTIITMGMRNIPTSLYMCVVRGEGRGRIDCLEINHSTCRNDEDGVYARSSVEQIFQFLRRAIPDDTDAV